MLPLLLNEVLPQMCMHVGVGGLIHPRSSTTVGYGDEAPLPTRLMNGISEARGIRIEHEDFPAAAWAPWLEPFIEEIEHIRIIVRAAVVQA